MKRIDASFLYSFGTHMAKVGQVDYLRMSKSPTTKSEARMIYFDGRNAVAEFLAHPSFKLKAGLSSAGELLTALNRGFTLCSKDGVDAEHVEYHVGSDIYDRLREFNAILKAELGSANIFIVEQKAAFDTQSLIFNGHLAFPASLQQVSLVAWEDAQSAMRCIAFELPTAAAFHLHRSNEAVLGIYWDAVTGNFQRPKNATLGSFIRELQSSGKGDSRVIAALDQIRSLHRNPTMHADYTLASVDEAIDLFGVVRSAIGFMIAEIHLLHPADQGSNALAGLFQRALEE